MALRQDRYSAGPHLCYLLPRYPGLQELPGPQPHQVDDWLYPCPPTFVALEILEPDYGTTHAAPPPQVAAHVSWRADHWSDPDAQPGLVRDWQHSVVVGATAADPKTQTLTACSFSSFD